MSHILLLPCKDSYSFLTNSHPNFLLNREPCTEVLAAAERTIHSLDYETCMLHVCGLP